MAWALPNLESVQRVLVIKPSSLGDIVHTLPAVRRIKRRFPHLRIDWLANPEWMPLLAGNPDLHEVIAFPRREFRGMRLLTSFPQWLAGFRKQARPEVVLDFQGLFRSGFLARSSGARCILGMTDSREGARFLHHCRIPVDRESHAVDRYLCLAAACGASEGPVQFPLPEGSSPQVVLKSSLPRDYVVLHPFSRGENKSLTVAQVRRFCERMAPTGVFVVGHTAIPEQLANLPSNAANILNQTTLPELCWLLRHARFTVSVDSGPMHMAAAITPKLLAIHTWSDPRMVGPYNPNAWIWKGGEIRRKSDITGEFATRLSALTDASIEAMTNLTWKEMES
jgi:ADP-heptose:LPS heptosyltransferase